eukprot:15337224-Ditylum_brightwellii.AAC.1
MGFWRTHNLQDMKKVSDSTTHLSDLGKLPPNLGSFPNIHSSKISPLPHPSTYLHTVHADIGFGDTVVPGGIKYCLLLVDQGTHREWIYVLKRVKGAKL